MDIDINKIIILTFIEYRKVLKVRDTNNLI